MKNHTKLQKSVLCDACLYEKSYKIAEFRASRRLFVRKIAQNDPYLGESGTHGGKMSDGNSPNCVEPKKEG